MMDLKLQEKRSSSNAQIPPLPRQTLTTVDSTFPLSRNAEDSDQRLEVGYFYEIDHTRLPSNSPVQLNPIRIVKVSDEVDLAVSLKFPSMYSVRTHFSCDVRRKARMSPVLDDKFLMDSDVAGEVLRRRIPPQELSERRDSWDFWVMPASLMETETVTNPSSDDESRSRDIVSKKGKLWSEIKNDGMVQWGVRRQVMFIGRHMEQNPQISSRDAEGNRLKDAQDELNEDTGKKERKSRGATR